MNHEGQVEGIAMPTLKIPMPVLVDSKSIFIIRKIRQKKKKHTSITPCGRTSSSHWEWLPALTAAWSVVVLLFSFTGVVGGG